MTKKVKKWGNSLAIRISKKEAELLGLFENDEIEVQQKENTLVIKSKAKKLKDLVCQIDNKRKHSLNFPEDKPKGKEVW
jgi:antitoxin component of MazEF toxin-antitoxin module